MIPTTAEAKTMWDTYQLPEPKRVHVTLVARVAVFLAKKLVMRNAQLSINVELLKAAALLHDIDKAIPRLPGERHPDAAVRVLREAGMEEVANLVAHHSLHFILDPQTAPTTWEEKLLYLADKMVKYEIITVDKRFALWRGEDLPQDAMRELDLCYPLVKQLEKEVFDYIGIAPQDVARLA